MLTQVILCLEGHRGVTARRGGCLVNVATVGKEGRGVRAMGRSQRSWREGCITEEQFETEKPTFLQE